MIHVAGERLKNDGILMVIWGWIALTHYALLYILQTSRMSFQMRDFLTLMVAALFPAGIIITLFYWYSQKKKEQTYTGITLKYLWITAFLCLVLINLIQFNVLHKITYELQHPIFMAIIAFAMIISGVIIRYKWLIGGGICFALLAYAASFFKLTDQLLIEAAGWLIAFIIPGHLLYAQRLKSV